MPLVCYAWLEEAWSWLHIIPCHCWHSWGHLVISTICSCQSIWGLWWWNQLYPKITGSKDIMTNSDIHSWWPWYSIITCTSLVILHAPTVLSVFIVCQCRYNSRGFNVNPSSSAYYWSIKLSFDLLSSRASTVVATCFQCHKLTTIMSMQQLRVWPKS